MAALVGSACRRMAWVLALVPAGQAAAAGPAAESQTGRWADIDAIVSYETRQVMASGVTRTDTWQERLVRRANHVWTERVLPRGIASSHAHETEAEHLGHKHLNAETAARWLSLAADGKIQFRLVDREHKAVVDVPAAEFSTVSFDGRYEAAATIVPPAVVQAMKAEGAGTAGGQWRSERNQGWSHRVLWSQAEQLALRVDSRRDDGSVRRTVTVRLQPAASGLPAPWQSLAGYASKHYDEYMD